MNEEENPWQCLSKKQIYDNNWLSLEHHDVITPSGTNGIYGKVLMKNFAIAILPVDENKGVPPAEQKPVNGSSLSQSIDLMARVIIGPNRY